MTLAIALFASVARAQEPLDTFRWFEIPEAQAALAVYLDWDQEPPSLTLAGANADQLDTIDWQPGLPLVRQYRLEPGDYEIHVEGLDHPAMVKLGAGQLVYLRLDLRAQQNDLALAVQTGPAVPLESDVSGILSALSYKGFAENIAPVNINPAGNQLHFKIEPPFIRHPSPRPPRPDSGGD